MILKYINQKYRNKIKSERIIEKTKTQINYE